MTRTRELHFEKLADIQMELDRIEQAHAAGRLVTTGNWSAGKILGHLAWWVERAYHGYPFEVPWLVRKILRLRKNKMLFGRMRPGFRLPRAPGGTYGTEEMTFEAGLQRYREALERLRVQPPVLANPALGDLNHHEWIALACRHAELHLGFLDLQAASAAPQDQNEARPTSV